MKTLFITYKCQKDEIDDDMTYIDTFVRNLLYLYSI